MLYAITGGSWRSGNFGVLKNITKFLFSWRIKIWREIVHPTLQKLQQTHSTCQKTWRGRGCVVLPHSVAAYKVKHFVQSRKSLFFFTFSIVEKSEEMTTSQYVTFQWQDSRLSWNPAEYDGVETLRLPPNLIWKPDIALYNKLEFHVCEWLNVLQTC